MTTIDKLCEILKAHSEGKKIECKQEFPTTERGVLWFSWKVIDPTQLFIPTLMNMELRIKPEPREIWKFVWNNGTISNLQWKSKSEAQEQFSMNYNDDLEFLETRGKFVKFREVLENE